MALHKLSEIQKLGDPLKQFQIKFTISMFPALKVALAQQKAAGSANTKYVIDNSETLELRCTSFSYPGTKINQSELIIAGFRRKLGTIQNKSGVWSCKIIEDQHGSILNTIQAWCDLIHNPFNGVKFPSTVYVSTCVLEIDSNIAGQPGRLIYLKGFYPIEYSVSNIDASGSAPVEIDVKFNYDWFTERATSISAWVG